jgi:hypothetical protein
VVAPLPGGRMGVPGSTTSDPQWRTPTARNFASTPLVHAPPTDDVGPLQSLRIQRFASSHGKTQDASPCTIGALD